jgi:hypothetical protein
MPAQVTNQQALDRVATTERVFLEGGGVFVIEDREGIVLAYDTTTVRIFGECEVRAFDAALVYAFGPARVEAFGGAQIVASPFATVTARDRAIVDGPGYMRGYDLRIVPRAGTSGYVRAYDSSLVRVGAGGVVEAFGTSTVLASASAEVIASDNALVEARDDVRVIARDHATVIHHGAGVVTVESPFATVRGRHVTRML